MIKMMLAGGLILAATGAGAGSPTGAEAIPIGNDLQVLWDDAVVDTTRTTALRQQHRPQCQGLAIAHDQPWEGDGSAYHSVFRDGSVYRMYYGTCSTGYTREQPYPYKPGGVRICYAESTDALHWTKPNLGLRAFNGSKENNIIIDGSDIQGLDNLYVFKDANPACPKDEVYKAVGQFKFGGGIRNQGELGCYLSADGVRFRRGWILTTKGAFDSLNVAFWDATRQRYFCYLRGLHRVKGERNGDLDVRDIRVMTSPDFRTWSEPVLLDFKGGEDYPLYTNCVQPYPRNLRLFVGFPTRYVERKKWTPNYERLPSAAQRRERMRKGHPRYGLAITDSVFMFSRDGFSFHREDEAFLTPGPEGKANWVYGDCYPAVGFIETPGLEGAASEYSFYSAHGHFMGGAERFYRYTLRKDGFVSRRAPYAGAKVVTKKLVFAGDRMRINFSTSARGRLYVTVRDEAGKELRSVELFGDQVDRIVDFEDGAALAAFAGRPVTLTFEMSDADLYSFGFLTTVAISKPMRRGGRRWNAAPTACVTMRRW